VRVELVSDAGGRLSAIAFRAADNDLGRFLLARRGRVVHIAGNLATNHWNGAQQIQFRIIDAADAE
jgi:single-stranded-DNA-specific exonuclease